MQRLSPKRSSLCDEAQAGGQSGPNLPTPLSRKSCAFGYGERCWSIREYNEKLERLYHQKYSVSKSGDVPGGEFDALLGTGGSLRFSTSPRRTREVDSALVRSTTIARCQ